MQDLCERSALKISARDLYRRSLVTISVRDLHTRYLKRSPGKISAQGLCEIDFLARSSIKDLRTRFLYRRSLHKILKRSPGKIAVQVLLDRISPQREWSDTHEVTRGLHEHMLESARATKSKHVIYDVLTRFLALFRRGPWRTCHEERAWAIWSTAPATKTDHHVANQKWDSFTKRDFRAFQDIVPFTNWANISWQTSFENGRSKSLCAARVATLAGPAGGRPPWTNTRTTLNMMFGEKYGKVRSY